MKLEGLEGLEQALGELKASTQKPTLRRVLKKSAEPMAEIARGLAPRDDGDLAASITVSAKLTKRQAAQHRKMFRDDRAAVEMFVGPAYNLGAGGRHGHLVEFGTAPHVNKGLFAGSWHPGTAPQPFMRPAWDQDSRAMLARIGVDAWAEIKKTMARAEKRAARLAARG